MTPQNRLAFTIQIQCIRAFSTTSECDVRDPLYTCIYFCPLVIGCEYQCKRRLQKFNVLSQCQSFTVGRVFGGEKGGKEWEGNGIDWAMLFPDLYSPFLSSLSSIHLLSLHGHSTHPQPAFVLQRSRAFFDIEMKNIPFSNEWMSACRLLVFLWTLCDGFMYSLNWSFLFFSWTMRWTSLKLFIVQWMSWFINFYYICQSVALQDHQ